MPPKPKVTKEMIIIAAFDIIREEGYENLSARSIAARMKCSTQPVLYCYSTIDEIKSEAYNLAMEFFNRYVGNKKNENDNPLKAFGISYIKFCRDNKNIFRFLFQESRDKSKGINLLFMDVRYMGVSEYIKEKVGCSENEAGEMLTSFLMLVHGYASLIANDICEFSEQRMLHIINGAFAGMRF